MRGTCFSVRPGRWEPKAPRRTSSLGRGPCCSSHSRSPMLSMYTCSRMRCTFRQGTMLGGWGKAGEGKQRGNLLLITDHSPHVDTLSRPRLTGQPSKHEYAWGLGMIPGLERHRQSLIWLVTATCIVVCLYMACPKFPKEGPWALGMGLRHWP